MRKDVAYWLRSVLQSEGMGTGSKCSELVPGARAWVQWCVAINQSLITTCLGAGREDGPGPSQSYEEDCAT